MTPRVSIVMPVRDGERFVAAAIESVIAQTFTDWELIVIENGSSDATSEIVTEYADKDERIQLIEEGPIGLVASLNKGLAQCRGHYVARMDADDISDPPRLERQVDYLDAHPDCVLVGTGYRFIDDDGEVIGRRHLVASDRYIRADIHFGNPISHPTVMMVPDRIGEPVQYSPDYPVAEDFELWLRLLEYGKFANITEVLLSHRIHGDAVTQTQGDRSRDSAVRALNEHTPWPHASRIHEATYNPDGQDSLREFLVSLWLLNRANMDNPQCSKGALAVRSAVAVGRRARKRLRR